MNILGGSKILCQMAVDSTEKGMRNAAQALSRIGITQDPSIAFPGNRVWISTIRSFFLKIMRNSIIICKHNSTL